MRHTTFENGLIPDVKSTEVKQMLSYGAVIVLLLIAISALSVHLESGPSEFVSNLAMSFTGAPM